MLHGLIIDSQCTTRNKVKLPRCQGVNRYDRVEYKSYILNMWNKETKKPTKKVFFQLSILFLIKKNDSIFQAIELLKFNIIRLSNNQNEPNKDINPLR